jgi:hypothetical protein
MTNEYQMKEKVLFSIVFMSALTCQAQINFEKGYFIDLQGNRTECLIKNLDWLYTPTFIKYKIDPKEAGREIDAKNIKEFGVDNLRYVRMEVHIDTSSRDPQKLSPYMDPEWGKKDLLLKILVEGKATLYHYLTSDLERFFYSLDNGPIEQLVYKTYLWQQQTARSAGHIAANQISANTTYLSQLKEKLNCQSISPIRMMKMPYDRSSMVKYFLEYNECSGASFIDRRVHYKSQFHVRITPGQDFSTFSLNHYGKADHYQGSNFRLGVEAEFILPMNKGKWATVVEPTFQQFGRSNDYKKVDYKSIELPLMLRHNIFLGQKAKIFVNAGVAVDFILHSKVEVSATESLQGKDVAIGLAGGVGFSFGRGSIEVRQYTNRHHYLEVPKEVSYDNGFQKTSLILGIKIF